MTQEEKDLLLCDLSARLPYGVIVKISKEDNGSIKSYDKSFDAETYNLLLLNGGYKERGIIYHYSQFSLKPYLRPLSSMTREEKNEVSVLLNYEFYIDDDYALVAEDDRHRVRLDLVQTYTDYLNKKMFAYRTLDDKNMFELGLALEAKPGMYNLQ